jgi:two-component system cell cycle sensor histidine kinase/response regulator CckA
MTATHRTAPPARAFDPLLLLMAVGFVVAVGALAYPAFRSNPMSAPWP